MEAVDFLPLEASWISFAGPGSAFAGVAASRTGPDAVAALEEPVKTTTRLASSQVPTSTGSPSVGIVNTKQDPFSAKKFTPSNSTITSSSVSSMIFCAGPTGGFCFDVFPPSISSMHFLAELLTMVCGLSPCVGSGSHVNSSSSLNASPAVESRNCSRKFALFLFAAMDDRILMDLMSTRLLLCCSRPSNSRIKDSTVAPFPFIAELIMDFTSSSADFASSSDVAWASGDNASASSAAGTGAGGGAGAGAAAVSAAASSVSMGSDFGDHSPQPAAF